MLRPILATQFIKVSLCNSPCAFHWIAKEQAILICCTQGRVKLWGREDVKDTEPKKGEWEKNALFIKLIPFWSMFKGLKNPAKIGNAKYASFISLISQLLLQNLSWQFEIKLYHCSPTRNTHNNRQTSNLWKVLFTVRCDKPLVSNVNTPVCSATAGTG